MRNAEGIMNGSGANEDAFKACGELKDKARQIKDEAIEMGHVAKDAVKEAFGALKSSGRESVSQLSDAFNTRREQLQSYVKASPMKSVMIGVGAGLALGYLASKARRA